MKADQMHPALLFEKLADDRVQCNLCAHRCLIKEGGVGVCRVRENREGELFTRVYGQTAARHLDPIEKKPLFHFYPGTQAYSIAAPGCNFRCSWCQNASISQLAPGQGLPGREYLSPKEVLAAARGSGARSIAYTYTEPTIFFEYCYDIARLAKPAGLKNVFVSNGYMTGEMLDLMHPFLDAVNVDLKGFREKLYRRYAGASLAPVLDNLRRMKELEIWVEVTTLIIPGLNDSQGELEDAAHFIASELGPGTPWHISRFAPAYRMQDRPATPVSKLLQAQKIGRETGLRYVYLGNVPGQSNTHCHHCGQLLISRHGYRIDTSQIVEENRCPSCGTPAAGRGLGPGVPDS